MSQHGAPFSRYIQNIAVTLLALVILDVPVGFLTIYGAVVLVLVFGKMSKDILNPVPGFGEEKIISIVRSRKVAVHTIGHHPMRVVGVSGNFPIVVSRLYFMTAGTEIRCGCSHHGVIGHAEQGKSQNKADNHPKHWLEDLFHSQLLQTRWRFPPVKGDISAQVDSCLLLLLIGF